MKKTLIYLTLVLSSVSTAFASPKHIIKSADELAYFLKNGSNVRAVVDTASCQDTSPYGDGISAVDFSLFNIYEAPSNGKMTPVIATNVNTMTHHRTYGPVIGYMRLRVTYDNKVEVFNEFVSMSDGKPLESYTINCAIEQGVRLYLEDF